MCPTMQEDYIEHVNTVDGTFNGQPQRKYDPFSNTYNPTWRDHPNFMGTSLNKAVKIDSSIPMDFYPNIIIKQDNRLHSQTPILRGRHPKMIFVR